jgi:hypothetical protein
MAEKAQAPDWRQIITNNILDTPDIPPFDKKAGKAQLVEVVKRIADQIAGEKKNAPNKLWRTRHDGAIIVGMKLKGEPIPVKNAAGEVQAEFAIPDGQAEVVLKGLIAAIENTDEFDEDIQAILENVTNKPRTASQASPQSSTDSKPSKRGTGIGNVARPDDAEWMEKFRAWAGDPDPSIVDPVPNTNATKWVARAIRDRGAKGYAARSKK